MTTTTIEEIVRLRAEYDEKLKSIGQYAIAEMAKKALAQMPDAAIGIKWEQYTPYFNDGDPCVFCVHEMYPIGSTDEDNYDTGDFVSTLLGDGYGWEALRADPAKQKRFDELLEQYDKPLNELAGIPDDVMLSVFGDHAEITILRDGTVTVEHVDHD